MSDKKTTFKDWLEYVFFKAFLLIVKLTPFIIGIWVGKALGLLAYVVLKERRELTLQNICRAREKGFLPAALNEKRLARKVWANLGTVGSEFLYYYTRPTARLKKAVRFSGEDNLRRVLDKQKGAILVMGHIGNWELVGMYLAVAGYKVTPIVKTQSNILVDKIIQNNRRSVGMKVIPRRSYLRPILDAFKNNEIVPFLIDQWARNKGVMVDVFGTPAPLPRGAVEFGLRTGTPVVFGYVIREKPGCYQLVISEEIPLVKTGRDQDDVIRNTATLVGLLQDVIKKHPEQWLWMHKLWREQ